MGIGHRIAFGKRGGKGKEERIREKRGSRFCFSTFT